MMQRMTPAAVHYPIEGDLPTIDGATGRLNSPPLTAAGLRGRVVLVDIWTYTCINWLRTLPYVRAWAEKYQDQGLLVLGVHAPEFMFPVTERRMAERMNPRRTIELDASHASLASQPGAIVDLIDEAAASITQAHHPLTRAARNASAAHAAPGGLLRREAG